MSLSPKQERFCQCIVSGMSGKDSYMTAYDSSGSAQNAYNEASKLLQREDIQERLQELRKPLETACQTKALSERERIKGILWDRLQRAIDRDDDTTIVKLTDQINRMNAEYINVNRNIEEKKTDINSLDIDTLKKLSGTL